MNILWPILRQAVRRRNELAAIDDRRTYTYGQLLGGAFFLAEKIDAVTGAPHVGILLPTSGAFPMALLGAWLARRAAVPLNYLLAKEELAYVIRDSEIDTIVTAGPILDHLGLRDSIPPGIQLVMLEQMDFTGFPPLRWPPVPATDDLAAILYTSGTSGKPKGVMLTHGNFAHNASASIIHAQITRADTFLGVLPQFHSFGLTALTLIPLLAGSKVVYSARFVPKRIVQLIREHRPDIIMFVPSMYGALLSVKDAAPEDFTSIRFPISGGEPLPDVVAEGWQSRFQVRLLEGYGLTETAPATNWSTLQRCRPHSVGPALPDVSIVTLDDQDRILPAGRDGEICIAGPNVMKGYFKLPRQTAAAFIELDVPPGQPSAAPGRQRYFRTGDIGRIDAEGFLYITGRKKEMLIIGGENVFPREIEEVLNRHPSVRDSAVLGRSDGLRGEVPIAFVELQDGAAFDDTALRTWCRENLAGYKVPREILAIDQLPRNPTGKVLRRQLRADLARTQGSATA